MTKLLSLTSILFLLFITSYSQNNCTNGTTILPKANMECPDIAPWISSSPNWFMTSDSYEGNFAYQTEGNYSLEYFFPGDGFAVADLVSASYWTWHEPGAGGIMSNEWTYSDGTTDSECCFFDDMEGWAEIDLLPFLDPTKNLAHIKVWGYAGGGPQADVTRFDNFHFCTAQACDFIDGCDVCEGPDECCEIIGGGCTDPLACNYDPDEVNDDGSCTYPGCTYAFACNYDPDAGCEDGSCEINSCAGCTNPIASNYDPDAILDDGSCICPVDNCPTDLDNNGQTTTSDLLIFLVNFGLICD